jgi:hypothetical protein
MVVQIHISTRIPENRRVILDLPPEAPTGDVELHLTIDDRGVGVPIAIPDLPSQRCEKSGLVRERWPEKAP